MNRRIGIVFALVLHCYLYESTAWAQDAAVSEAKKAPTTSRDPTPKFNMDYFVGEWAFESNLAETPFTGWPPSGTETVRNIFDGRFWDIKMKGEGDKAPSPESGLFIYQDTFAGEFFARYQVLGDLSFLMTGPVGCDLGGTCNMYFETTPFEQNGSLLSLKGRYYLSSPVSYRLQIQISINKEQYTNLGTVVYTKNEGVKPSVIK